MSASIFIDGEAGTTGLQIRKRLSARPDIALIQLPDAKRKDIKARQEALNEADIAILCLPDDAARQSVALIENKTTRVIDASTAHRIDPDWTYGFAEMTPTQAQTITDARYVTNPGCYPQGFIAAVRPLIEADILPADFPLTYNAISGYSGGGKAMIADYETDTKSLPYLPYALLQKHKHLPEMQMFSGSKQQPVFQPAVGNYAQGMIGAVPLALWALPSQPTAHQVHEILVARYANSTFIEVAPLGDEDRSTDIVPEILNGTNTLRLHVFPNPKDNQVIILSLYDNLGKGASGAAVQNLNLMLGIAEDTGLKKG